MSKLPEHIILITYKDPSKANKDILKILKEYFSDVPHIKYTDFKDSNCCILPYNATNRNVLHAIGDILYSNMGDVFGFMSYDLECGTSLFVTYSRSLRRPFLNSLYFPYSIKITPTYKRKLRLLMED